MVKMGWKGVGSGATGMGRPKTYLSGTGRDWLATEERDHVMTHIE
jgi:hypothetical protein